MTSYSAEDAWYDCGGSLYFGGDEGFQQALANVLVRLPDEIRDFVLRRCVVFSVGRVAAGITWPARVVRADRHNRPCWIIVMDEDADDLESCIAHELAHAWLKHDLISRNPDAQCEAEAANLARKWGFEGIGADAEHCSSHYRVRESAGGPS